MTIFKPGAELHNAYITITQLKSALRVVYVLLDQPSIKIETVNKALKTIEQVLPDLSKETLP